MAGLTDTFTRADSAVSPGSPTTGGPYTAALGTWGISSNQLYCATSTSNGQITWPAAIDTDATVTINATGANGTGLIVRRIDASNYWFFGTGTNGQLSVIRVVAAGFAAAIRWSLGAAPTLPVTIRLRCIGSVIHAYVNGVLVYSGEDDAFASATATSGLRASSTVAARFDNLTVADSSAIGSLGAGSVLNLSTLASGVPQSFSGHVYKGRDRKTDDTAAAA